MRRIDTIERRIQKIKEALVEIGDMRPGSLSVQERSWQGKYYQLSYTHRGKGHTEYVSKNNRDEVRKQTANYRRFRKLTQEWVELGIELCRLKARHKEDD